MEYFYYKSGNNFILTKSPLDTPLPEGIVATTKKEYEKHLAKRKREEDQLKASPAYLRMKEIAGLKSQLRDTDYQAIKYAEGALTEEEYAPIKTQRQQWRDRINELESEDE